MNFAPIAFLDPFELAGSLRTRMGLFRPSGEASRRVLPVRYQREGEPGIFFATKEAAKWPELKIMLEQIKQLGETMGGIEFGEIEVELLVMAPHEPLDWRREAEPPDYDRAYMALRTNPGVRLFRGVEAIHLEPGYLTGVNRRAWASAINLGAEPAVHLIVDWRRTPARQEPI